jgi:hypothetical protein
VGRPGLLQARPAAAKPCEGAAGPGVAEERRLKVLRRIGLRRRRDRASHDYLQAQVQATQPPPSERSPDTRSCLICKVIVRSQDQEHCASISRMIRHYVARRAQLTEGHPHNAADGAMGSYVVQHRSAAGGKSGVASGIRCKSDGARFWLHGDVRRWHRHFLGASATGLVVTVRGRSRGGWIVEDRAPHRRRSCPSPRR